MGWHKTDNVKSEITISCEKKKKTLKGECK